MIGDPSFAVGHGWSLRFLQSHGPLAVLSILSGVFLYRRAERGSSAASRSPGRLDQALLWLNGLLLSVMIVWGYPFRSAFYNPLYPGSSTDGYEYLRAAFEDPCFFSSAHMAYPVIPARWIGFLVKTGILDPAALNYPEKAFLASAYPGQLVLIVGLAALFWIYRFKGWSWLKTTQGTLLMAVTAACWIWDHQSNGITYALGLELLAMSLCWHWLETRRRISLAGCAIVLGACVFAHAATIYFVLIVSAYVGASIWAHRRKRGPLPDFSILAGVLGSLGVLFYWFAAQETRSLDPIHVFRNLSDVEHLGEFHFPLRSLPSAIGINLEASLMNLANVWVPRTHFDLMMIAGEIAVLSAVAALLVARRRAVWGALRRDDLRLAAFVSAGIFAAFLMRDAGSRHFTTIVVPNTLLLTGLLFSEEGAVNRRLAQSLIVVMFLFSGFSTCNAFLHQDARADIAYRINAAILSRIASPGGEACYLGAYHHPCGGPTRICDGHEMLVWYYHKFDKIIKFKDPSDWQNQDWLRKMIPRWRRQRMPIFMSDEAAEVVRHVFPDMNIRHLEKSLHQLE